MMLYTKYITYGPCGSRQNNFDPPFLSPLPFKKLLGDHASSIPMMFHQVSAMMFLREVEKNVPV